MDFEIQLRSVQDVLRFVELATSRDFSVQVSDCHHQVNGKSFMEMFCLNLKQPITVHLVCSETECARFRQEAAGFAVAMPR